MHILIWLGAAATGSILFTYLASTWLIKGALVPSTSMLPTLAIGDRVVYTPLDGPLTGVQRGEVVVFADPGGWIKNDPGKDAQVNVLLGGAKPSGEGLVKRVIGVGGDVVACCDAQGRIQLNGQGLDEEYIKGRTDQVRFAAVVPEGRVFVLGDNRAASADSRYHLSHQDGTISEELILGRAWAVLPPRGAWLTLPESYPPEP